MTEIKFYTPDHDRAVLDFALTTEADGWKHTSRGVIVHSTRQGEEGKLAVLWPRCGGRFATTPATREDTAIANAWVMERALAWLNRGREQPQGRKERF